MDKNELKKELMKSKVDAQFSHYCSGNLYYNVQTNQGLYQFPISTVDRMDESISLSSDLGTTNFNSFERASMFWRWIDKSISSNEFSKIG